MSKLSLKPMTDEVADVEDTDANLDVAETEDTNADYLNSGEKEALESDIDERFTVSMQRMNKAVEYVSQKFNLSSDYSIVSYAEKKNSVIVCVDDNNTSLKVEINNPYEVGIYSY